MAKIVCEITLNGVDVVKVFTTAPGTEAAFVKVKPGVGKQFWCWPTIPSGTVIGAEFTGAPIVSESVEDNAAAIAAISAQPGDVLVYQT